MDPNVIDPNAMVRALDKLLDYTASGIGAIAGPMLAPWQARREALARQIQAQGEADAQRIEAQGQADSLLTIADAQSQARHALVSTASGTTIEIDISETVRQRIQFQEEKRHRNIGYVVGHTAELLGDMNVPNQNPDHDWTARFFDYIQDVSSEEMKYLWAKVLSGEIQRPGKVSIRSLSILRDLDQRTAALFGTLCSASILLSPDGITVLDARVPSLGGAPAQNSLQKYGLTFDNLNVLNEHGLIIGDYDSSYDIRMSIGIPTIRAQQPNAMIRVPFTFQGRHWILEPTPQSAIGQERRLHGVALTQAGKELYSIVEQEPIPDYHQALVDYFASQHLTMTEVDSPRARITTQIPS